MYKIHKYNEQQELEAEEIYYVVPYYMKVKDRQNSSIVIEDIKW